MPTPPADTPVLTFEQAMSRLEAIVAELESDEADLEEALRQYEEGLALARLCLERLRTAEMRVQELELE